jgi:hypothetical protein
LRYYPRGWKIARIVEETTTSMEYTGRCWEQPMGKKSIQDGRGFSLGAFASLIERPLLFSGCEVLRR